ncbi:MAG: baseplate J/gp47 family protein [Thermomicrobiales bacterium]|nr:baseplate J/gp47 family protein [Thermomicrobiales bacterium]
MPKRQDPPPPTHVLIDADASMPAVLTEVRRHVDEAIVLVVPDQCPVLLTVAEFRALKDTAERAGVQLTIESNVSLRNQLASMFGIRTTSEAAAAKGGWRPPDTLLGNTRAYDTWVQQPNDDQPRKRKRRSDPGHVDREESHRPKGNGTGSLDYIELDTDSDAAIGATARKIGKILAVVVSIGLFATIAGWYALPNVTVVATPKTTSVTSEVNYAVAAEGANLPSDIAFTVPATAAEADVPYTITVKTTGVKRTPQETAHGEVILRNPTGAEVTVPAGTTLSIHAGASYTTDSDVKVPAAANNVSGEATVSVTATEAGSAGNAEPGILTGVIADLGVYYSNRDAAIEGGTDIEEPIVAEADITSLDDKLVNDYTKAAAAGWNSQLPEGQSVVEPSVVADQPKDKTTAQVGDSAAEISVSGTVHASGLIYDQNEVDQLTTEYFQESLQAQVPEGYAIDPESVVLESPLALASSPDNVQFRVSATATAYAVVSDDLMNDIRGDIAGKSWDAAHARLDQVEQWESYELTISPGWWFKRMPRDDGRIDIQIVDLSQTNPTPAASPGD